MKLDPVVSDVVAYTFFHIELSFTKIDFVPLMNYSSLNT